MYKQTVTKRDLIAKRRELCLMQRQRKKGYLPSSGGVAGQLRPKPGKNGVQQLLVWRWQDGGSPGAATAERTDPAGRWRAPPLGRRLRLSACQPPRAGIAPAPPTDTASFPLYSHYILTIKYAKRGSEISCSKQRKRKLIC